MEGNVFKRLAITAVVIMFSGLAGYVSGQKSQPTVSINPNIARYQLEGSKLRGEARKNLRFVNLGFNDAVIPCIVVDTLPQGLGDETIGNASISCGWTPESIAYSVE